MNRCPNQNCKAKLTRLCEIEIDEGRFEAYKCDKCGAMIYEKVLEHEAQDMNIYERLDKLEQAVNNLTKNMFASRLGF